MLLRFKAGNVSSIADRQELSLVAGKLKGSEEGLLPIPGGPGLQAVPVALLYGANASGKTSFVRAFTFMRLAVLSSHSQRDPKGGVPRISFALDEEIKNEPSYFEAEFVVDRSRYIFGFTCDNEKFLTEWLYSFPEGKRRKLYEREEKNVDFGSTMIGSKKTLVEFMRDNSLFISTATQNDHEELSKVAQFFRSIEYSGTLSASPFMVTSTFKEGQIDPRTIEFLRNTGTGIVGIQQHEKEIPEHIKALNLELLAIARKHLGDDTVIESDSSGKDVEIQLIHQGLKGQVALPLRSESAGTRRLLLMMSKVLRALDTGTLLIIERFQSDRSHCIRVSA